MLTGHLSHQVGLDADIWLTPMPDRELTRKEREEMSATNVVAKDRRDVDPAIWTPAHVAVIKAAAQDKDVERILVNAAIKKAVCRDAGKDRDWLHKVRPWWGHNYHFHVRIGCPPGSVNCKAQDPTPPGDGCGKELDYWFQEHILFPPPPKEPPKPRPEITMDQLPAECRQVLLAP
jgi:penicillin-insensitive murein endopeptidase